MRKTRAEAARFRDAIVKVALLTAKREKPDEVIINAYFAHLQDFNIDTIEEVADYLCRNETDLISVPPPGRWREVAGQLFELRPKRVKRPGELAKCDVCEDSGFRIFYDAAGVRRAATCNHDGTPNEEPPDRPLPAVSMYDLEGEVGPPTDGQETELARKRREHGNRLLHCLCCGAPYRVRLGMRCYCRKPEGWSVAQWIRLSHVACPNPSPEALGKGNARCRHHCLCTPEQRQERTPKFFPTPAEGQHVDAFLKEQGLRDTNAPGPADEPPLEEPPDDFDVGF